MVSTAAFSENYNTARSRFRKCVNELDWTLESYPITAKGSNGEQLSIDVGYSKGCDPKNVFVISSGIHGVEGFFGSAVQTELLQQWAKGLVPSSKCVFIHGLNPYGFSWRRRFDENNVDLNRNFLLSGDYYKGAPKQYAQLNNLLNPECRPSLWEPFVAKALLTIARHGMPALQQAVASGQYEFSRGLFYGGSEPSEVYRLLDARFASWLVGSERVVHLDLHTGLGAKGVCKLLIDYEFSRSQQTLFDEIFGDSVDAAIGSNELDYQPRGGFGPWCVGKDLASNYLFATAEFGTASPLNVLKRLRAENQAHHWGDPSSSSTSQAKKNLKDIFCPTDEKWRKKVLESSTKLVDRTLQNFQKVSMSQQS